MRQYSAADFTVPHGTARSSEGHGSFRDERNLIKMKDTNHIRDPNYIGPPGPSEAKSRHGRPGTPGAAGPPGVSGYQRGRSDVKEIESNSHRRHNTVYSEPLILKDLKGVSAILNSTATFVCEANGTPKPEISWKVNGKFSNEIPNAKVIRENTLHFQRVEKSNEGAVECIARNFLGQDRQTANLTVLGK